MNSMYCGEKIRLREYKKDDLATALEYVNDEEVKRLLNPGIPFPLKMEDEMKWYESITGTSSGLYSFAIETLKDNSYIGGCGINQIDWKNSIATVGIFIGDKALWNKGYGTDTMQVLVNFIFSQMNIRKVKLNVYSFNPRAVKCYEKCGFKTEGILRQEIFRDGKYYDEFVMGLLRDEWRQT